LLPFTSPFELSPFVTNNIFTVDKAMKDKKTRNKQARGSDQVTLLPFSSPLVLSPFVTNSVLAVSKAMKEEKTRSMQANKMKQSGKERVQWHLSHKLKLKNGTVRSHFIASTSTNKGTGIQFPSWV
jgi:hypothetical protein